MAVRDVGELRARMRLDASGLQSGVNSVRHLMNEFGAYMGAGAIATAAFNEAWRGLQSSMQEELALARVRVVMQNFGLDTQEAVTGLTDLATAFVNVAGIGEEEVYATFQKMLGVTKDYNNALQLTNLLTRVQIAYGGDIAAQFAAALGTGNVGRLPRILAQMGIDVENNMESIVTALRNATKDIGTVLDAQAIKLQTFREQWRNFTESLAGNLGSPVLIFLKSLVTAFVTLETAIASVLGTLVALGNTLRQGWTKDLNFKQMMTQLRADMEDYVWSLWGEESVWGKLMSGFWTKQGLPSVGGIGNLPPGGGKTGDEAGSAGRAAQSGLTLLERIRRESEIYGAKRDEQNAHEQAALDAIAQQWERIGDVVADIATNVIQNLIDGTFEWQDALNAVLSTVMQIVNEMMRESIHGWVSGIAQGIAGGGQGAGQASIRGGGGGTTINIQAHPSGTIFQLMRGNRVEFSRFAEDTYIVGGNAVASR